MLKELREKTGMTQSQFSKAIGENVTTVCMWEKGRSVPRIKKFPKIAEVLGVTTDEVIDCFIEKK